MKFDINAARSSGYSDDEIAEYLATENKFDLSGALESGYSASEVIGFLSGRDPAQRDLPDDVKPSEAGGGRGFVNPPMATERQPERQQPGLIARLSSALPKPVDPLGIGGDSAPSQKPRTGAIASIGAALKPEFKSVMDGYEPTPQERQAEIDKRLSYGAGPISQKAAATANDVRSSRGQMVSQDLTVNKVVKAMDASGEKSLADIVESANRPAIVQAERDAKAEESRTAGEWAADTLSSLSQGAVGLVQLPINIIAPSSEIASTLRKTQKELQAQESDVLKAQREQLRERVQNEDGFLDKYAATVVQLVTSPALGLSEAVKQIPNFLGIVGASRLVGAASAGGVGLVGRASPTFALGEAISGGAIQAGARAAGTTAGGVGASMVMAGGDAAGGVYDKLTDPRQTPLSVWQENPDYQELVASGKTSEQAIVEIATAKARMAALVTAPLGLLGFMGAEAAVASRGLGRATAEALTVAGAGKMLAKDVIGEQLEEGGTQFGGNVISRTVDPSQKLSEGVPEAMGTALVTSAPFSAVGAASQFQEARAAQAPDFATERQAVELFDVNNYDPTLISPAQTARGVADVGPSAPISFTPAGSPTQQAGLVDIAVPVPTAEPMPQEQTTELPPINPQVEQEFGLDKLRMGTRDVSTLGATGGQLDLRSPAGSDQLGGGLGLPGLDAAGTGQLRGGDAGLPAANAGANVPAGGPAGQPTPGIALPRVAARATDQDLLARTEAAIAAPENNNAVVQPVEQWVGRKGDGYVTEADATQALPGRQRMFPALEWTVEQMPSGKFRLAGYEQQNTQPAPTVGTTEAGAGTPQPTQAAPITAAAPAAAEPITAPSGAPFSTAQAATVFARQNGITDFTTQPVDGGFVIQPAAVAAPEVEPAPAAPAVEEAAAPEPITAPSGKPFSTEKTAAVFAQQNGITGYSTVKMGGGWVIKPTETTLGNQTPQAIQGQTQGQEPAIGGAASQGLAGGLQPGDAAQASLPEVAGAAAPGVADNARQLASAQPELGQPLAAGASEGERAAVVGGPLFASKVKSAPISVIKLAQDYTTRQSGVEFAPVSSNSLSEQQRAASLMATLNGQTVTFIEQTAGDQRAMPNGLAIAGKHVMLDVKSEDAVLAVAMHEIGHNFPEKIKLPLEAALRNLFKSGMEGDFKREFNYDDADLDKEIPAMITQAVTKRKDFWNELRQEMGNKDFSAVAELIITRLDNWVRGVRKEYGEGFISKYVTDVNQARSLIAKAYAQSMREQGLQPNEALATDISSSRRAKTEKVGEFDVAMAKDGSITVYGDSDAIRSQIPEDIKGRVTSDGITFTNAAAPRVRAALEGRQVAYSRGGQVTEKLPMRNGKYLGAPAKFDTPGKIPTLRKILRQLADEGAPGRYWYENSGKAVLKMVGGDVNEARKFVALLAIYSPQAKVDANSTFALRAWAQYKAGQPISVKTQVMDDKAKAALDDVDAFWSGEKTGNFFFNLLREIDPTTAGKQGATIDMWMMRAGQYDTDAPTGTQYSFMENETNRLAQELGWEPQQVQAAIWVAMKARMENKGVKKETERTSEKKGWIKFVPGKDGKGKVRVILDAQKHRDNWLKYSFEHDVTKDDTQQAKFDFGDGLQRHIGQVSFEARPGRTSGVLPGIHSAPYAQQVEFQQAVQKAFFNADGTDELAAYLGLLVDSDILAPGVWQGEISPSTQLGVAMAPAKGTEGKTNVDPAQAKALNIYAAVAGLVARQEGVGWHRPFYASTKRDANGLDINVGRVLNPREVADLETAVGQWMADNGKAGWQDQFAFVSSPSGIRVVNFGIITNEKLQSDIVKVAESVLPDGEVRVFASSGDMPTNNWKENPNGETYVQRIGAEGRPDVLDWARAVLAPRVQKVFDEYSERYGWGEAGKLSFSNRAGGREGGRRDADRQVPASQPRKAARGAGKSAQDGRLTALPGAPRVEGFTGPDPRLVAVAEQYARDNGITLRRQAEYAQVDPERAARIAAAYEAMPHAPQDLRVKAAYKELIAQTVAQYRSLERAGYKFWFIDLDKPGNAEYASSPWNAMRDMRANKVMGVFPTEAGFGSGDAFKDNPLETTDTGIKWPSGSLFGPRKRVLANDLFRAVHDAFGHGLEGAGFRAQGEENAWQAHVRLFTGAAVAAITSETRGQNSWLNYGPNGESNRTAKVEDTVFADQKTGLLPEFAWTEGRVGDMPMFSKRAAAPDTAEFKKWFGDSKVVDGYGKPLVMYHGTDADIATFEPKDGMIFVTADPKFAEEYTTTTIDSLDKSGGQPNIIPVYVKAENPFDYENPEHIAALEQYEKDNRYTERSVSNYVRDIKRGDYEAIESRKVQAAIKALGHDGFYVREAGRQVKNLGVFRPEQIKSATGNDGSFDATNPDIRRSNRANDSWFLGRDETGRIRLGAGAKAYRAVADLASNVLDKVGMKPISTELNQAMRQMKVEIDKAREITADVAGKLGELSEQEREMISDVIEQELKRGVKPAKRVLEVAASMQDIMSEQTAELVRLGMLSADAAGRWDGKYLPRFYESKLKDDGKAWAKAAKALFGKPKTMQGIGGSSLKGRGIFQTVPVAELEQWLADGWEERDPNFDPAVDSEITVWRDYTRSEREGMGEIRDSMFRFIMGYNKSQRDISLGRLYENIADTLASKSEKEGFVQVPSTNVEDTRARRYGKLAGKWVPKEVLDHLSGFDEFQNNDLMRMYLKAMSMWKEGKTVLNPVSHANNVLSNVTMAHFAGVSYWDVQKYLGATRDIVKDAPMLQEAKEAGLWLGTMTQTELVQMLPDQLKVLAAKTESTSGKAVDSVWNAMAFWLRKPMGKAYEAEDLFFRYLIYRDARQTGLEPAEAVDYAQKYIFTYDDLPKGARRVRDFALPFFAYTYKVAPTLAQTALEQPWRLAAPAAVLYTINAMMYAFAAGGEEDDWMELIRRYMTDEKFREKANELEKEERVNLPEWVKGSTSIGTPKAVRLGTDEVTGLPLFLDLARVFPGGDLFDAHNNAGGVPLLAPITPNHPILTSAAALLFNKDTFRGTDIVKASDTDAEAASKRAKWAYQQIAPAIAIGNGHFDRAMNVIANATGKPVDLYFTEYTGIGKDGLPAQPGYAAMQTVGIKVRPYDLEVSADIAKARDKKLVREIDAEISSTRRLEKRGAITEAQAEKVIERQKEKRQRLKDGLTVDGEEQD